MSKNTLRKTSLQARLVTATKRIGAILVITLLWTFFCYGLYQLFLDNFVNELLLGRSGDKLFRVFLLDPIPESVNLLHSQDDRGFGDYIFLHFKISPDDFGRILASEKYEVSSFIPISGYYNDTNVPTRLAWWNLRSLGKNAMRYSVNIEYDSSQGYHHERFQTIWVNSQKDEVYFKVTFIN